MQQCHKGSHQGVSGFYVPMKLDCTIDLEATLNACSLNLRHWAGSPSQAIRFCIVSDFRSLSISMVGPLCCTAVSLKCAPQPSLVIHDASYLVFICLHVIQSDLVIHKPSRAMHHKTSCPMKSIGRVRDFQPLPRFSSHDATQPDSCPKPGVCLQTTPWTFGVLAV